MFKPQRSFSAGELAPELHSRADTEKYQAGAKKIKNFLVQKFGGLVRRPGTEYIGECALDTDRKEDKWGPPRLIPWNAGAGTGYVLEFGHKTLRIIRNGEYVKVGGGWAAIDEVATSGLVTLNVKPAQRLQLKSGNAIIQVKNVWAEAPELHDMYYRAGEYTDAARPTFYLHDFTDDTDANRRVTGSTVTALGWVEVVYERTTPIHLKAAREMRYSMANGVMTLTHPDIPVLEVSKGRGNDQWSIFSPFGSDGNVRVRSKVTGKSVKILPPVAVNTDGYAEFTESTVNKKIPWKRYCVSTVDGDGNESLPRYSNYIQKLDGHEDGDGIANAVTPNASAYGLPGVSMTFDSDKGTRSGSRSALKIVITPDAGTSSTMDGNQKFTVVGRDYFGVDVTETMFAANFEGDGSTTNYEALSVYSTNYYRQIRSIRTDRSGSRFDVGWVDWDWDNITLNWAKSTSKDDLASPVTYKIYRSDGGLFGLIGIMTSNESTGGTIRFQDADRTPDFTETPPVVSTPFPDRSSDRAMKYALSPGAVCSYQQRRIVAGSDTFPSRVWSSGIGKSGDFNTRHILKSSDPFYFDLASDKFQNIMHLLSLNKIVVFTDSGEWILEGDEAGSLSPTTVNARQLSHMGSGLLAPEMIGNDAVFYQPRGSIVRDLGYTFKGLEESGDLTVFAYHLLREFKVTAWAYQRSPDSVLWCVRDDGILLSLTYVKEQRIVAWCQHEIAGDGKVRDICVVPEGESDSIYVTVEREELSNFSDITKYYVERLTGYNVSNHKMTVSTDSSIRQNGWRTRGMACGTMTLSNPDGTYGWTDGDKVRVTMTNDWFDPQTRFIATQNKYRSITGQDVQYVQGLKKLQRYGAAYYKWDEKYQSNPEFYDRLLDTDNLIAGKKVLVGKEKVNQVAQPGSIGQTLRPSDSNHAFANSGSGWVGLPRLKVIKYISPTQVDCVILGAVGVHISYRSVALHVWSFAGVTFRNDAISITEIASGGFAVGASVTVNCRCPNFVSTALDAGVQVHIGDPTTPNTNSIITITSVTNTTTAVGTVSQAAVPSYAQATYTYRWGRAAIKLYGLNHIRSEDVSIYGDGTVLSSPYNSEYSTVTVGSDGTAALGTPAIVASAGLPFISDFESLEIDRMGAGSRGDNQIKVGRVTIDCIDTQGGHAGPVLPSTDTALTDMVPLYLNNPGETTATGDANTGSFTTTTKGDWDEDGKIAVRFVDPTPAKIRAVHPHVEATRRGSPR